MHRGCHLHHFLQFTRCHFTTLDYGMLLLVDAFLALSAFAFFAGIGVVLWALFSKNREE